MGKHRGTLTDASIEKMKASGLSLMSGLTCAECSATVTGILDFRNVPIPLDHVVAGTQKKYNSGKRTGDKR
jgi:hypothetical protein